MRETRSRLKRVFQNKGDMREAHYEAQDVLQSLAEDRNVLGVIFEHILSKRPQTFFDQGCYPQPGFTVIDTGEFSLALNCWLPRADGREDISTKTIHHHGKLLLTTVCIFGPGYEHWVFHPAEAIDPRQNLFDMRLASVDRHPKGHVAFVDSFWPHCPFHPPELTVTLALWSSQNAPTFLSRLKKQDVLQRYKTRLRDVATTVGATELFDLNPVTMFDFYPSSRGFVNMPSRVEFPRGPKEIGVQNFFHILQQTGNASLERAIRHSAAVYPMSAPLRATVDTLLTQLGRGDPIPPAYWSGHDQEHAHFTKDAVMTCLHRNVDRSAAEQRA